MSEPRRLQACGVTWVPEVDDDLGGCVCALQVARDFAVKHWRFGEDLGEVDADYGSGYPGGTGSPSRVLRWAISALIPRNQSRADV